MDTRVRLDNPMFVGRVRQDRRTSSYVRRTNFDVPLRTRKVGAEIHSVPVLRTGVSSMSDIILPVSSTRTVPALDLDQVRAPEVSVPTQVSRGRRLPSAKVAVLYGMSGILFIGGMFTVVSSLMTDKQITAQVQNLSQPQSGDKKDVPAAIPATDKPTTDSLSKYTVAPDKPRFITIPSQDQKARILPMGTEPNGQLTSPNNIYDIGWYTGSSLPGQPGAMLVDGHKSSWKANGTFFGLKKLEPGDKVSVERGDGTLFTYRVVKSQIFDHDKVDMVSALKSVDPTRPGLNLITCEGGVIPGTSKFDKRIIVYAVLE